MAHRRTPTRTDISSPTSSKKTFIFVGVIAGVVLLAIAAMILYTRVGRPLLAPKNTVTFQPDSTVLGSIQVSQESLQETANVLSQRLNFLGFASPWASFTANNANQIVAKLPASLNQDFIDHVKVTGVLEFVDFGARSMAPGTQVNTDYTYGALTVEGTQWHTLMTGGQIKTISVYHNPNGGYEVLFGLTDKGKQILADYSSQNKGSYLGFVLDKVVIACPQVNGPITDGAGVINGNFTQQQAEIFAAVIRSGPLPIPIK